MLEVAAPWIGGSGGGYRGVVGDRGHGRGGHEHAHVGTCVGPAAEHAEESDAHLWRMTKI